MGFEDCKEFRIDTISDIVEDHETFVDKADLESGPPHLRGTLESRIMKAFQRFG